MEYIIEVKNLVNKFAHQVVHDNLNLSIKTGEICALVGASGAGKTTLLKNILNLHQPFAGEIKVMGINLQTATADDWYYLKRNWGVLFQNGALFSSLTVADNICFPLTEFTDLSKTAKQEITELRLLQVGLHQDVLTKYPTELSGGMLKRVALARAIVMEPKLLFLDEPTSGLDPDAAHKLDELLLSLQTSLGLTIIIITHDVSTIFNITNQVAFLSDGKLLAKSHINDLLLLKNNEIQQYFANSRVKNSYNIA